MKRIVTVEVGLKKYDKSLPKKRPQWLSSVASWRSLIRLSDDPARLSQDHLDKIRRFAIQKHGGELVSIIIKCEREDGELTRWKHLSHYLAMWTTWDGWRQYKMKWIGNKLFRA